MLAVVITAASVQDRNAARPLLWILSAAPPATTNGLPEAHEAMVLWAMVTLITQHLAHQRP